MSNAETNMRFFLQPGVLEWLSGKLGEAESLAIRENWNFSFDLIDQPFAATVDFAPAGGELKAYIRSEIGVHTESPDLSLQLSINGDDLDISQIQAGSRLGNAQQLAMTFTAAALALGMQLQEQGLLAEFSDLDPESEGVTVSLQDEVLYFQRVAGKARPAMACTTLFGGVQLMRPYEDEIMNSWMGELMSLEEKLELAEDGDEDMMEQLALAYLNGDDDVEADPEQAAYWFAKLAEAEHSDAQFNLGLFYAKGFGVERSFRQAIEWLERAAENGDSDAPGLIEKLRKGLAAEQIVATGDAQAQADLADVYMFLGKSLDQGDSEEDFAIAFDMAQKSAAQNNGDGLWVLALAYEHGRGVEQDKKMAVDCYRRGADLGHAPSQHSLACYYMRGEIVELDQELGFGLMQKSAEQGYYLALKGLGTCYQFGNGVQDDMKLAIEWYEKYLETTSDPELEQKVALFKMLEEGGSFDLGGNEDAPCADLPEGFDEMMDLIIFAEENGYEDDGSLGTDGHIAFVEKLAQSGNPEAREILENYRSTNG